jgi:hypothetical protein
VCVWGGGGKGMHGRRLCEECRVCGLVFWEVGGCLVQHLLCFWPLLLLLLLLLCRQFCQSCQEVHPACA